LLERTFIVIQLCFKEWGGFLLVGGENVILFEEEIGSMGQGKMRAVAVGDGPGGLGGTNTGQETRECQWL
jgi:hypothetical protein